MKLMVSLTAQSLWHRRTSASLTLITIAFSIMLLLGVEKVRTETRNSFANTLSGTDLVVGARSGQVQLLLYSVFRMGDATSNISWQTYQKITNHRLVDWTVPISLGDSHRGYKVLGTNENYFKHYRYGNRRALQMREGKVFSDLFDVVLGAEVAEKLGYKLGDRIVVSHGMGGTSFARHDDKPFIVTGILSRTGTPVDQTLHLSLEALEAIHIDWKSGVRDPNSSKSVTDVEKMQLQPKQITAFLVGMKSKVATFQLQRAINNYRKEPLMAILPGIALQKLWDMIGLAEKALLLVSGLVVLVGFIGMLTVLLAGLNERRRELAILRSVGAKAWHVLLLLGLEAVFLTGLGIILGVAGLYLSLFLFQGILESELGVFLPISLLSLYQLKLLAVVMLCGAMVGLIPGYQAYRNSVSDGLTVRL